MPVYDDITAAWNEARPILADAFHPDDYEIERMVRVPDGYGGHTNQPQTVESGKCSLTAATRVGAEGAQGSVTVSVSNYTVELPIESTLVASDTLYVNGRKFNVIDVLQGGDHEIFVTANVEEVS